MKTTLFVVVSSVLSLLASSLSAQTLIWDANATTAGQPNGSGQWLGTNQWWDGAANVTWNNGGTTIAQLGVTGSAVVAPNTVTITGATPVNVAGLNFMGFVTAPTTVSSNAQQYTIAGATGGTLNFANNSTINIEDLASGGSNFVTLASTLLVTGNGLTIQKSSGTLQQFMSFGMTSNPGLTGALIVKGNNGGVFFRSSGAGTFSAMSSVTVEANSVFSMSGGGTYTVPLSIAGTGGNGNYGAIRVDTSNTTVNANITLTADAAIQTNTGGITGTVVNGTISGPFGFRRFATGAGIGTLALTAANTYTGATSLGFSGIFTGAITTLDFTAASAPEDDILYNGVATPGALNVIGGSYAPTVLNLAGKAGLGNSQRFGNVVASGSSTSIGGLSTINLTSGVGGTMDLSLGTITRLNQGMIAFAAPASGTITTTTANGFIGPWATYRSASGTTSWAQVSAGTLTGGFTGDLNHVTGTTISALPGYATTSNLNITDGSTGNITVTGATTDLRTLTMNDQGYDRTVALSASTLRLATDGGVQLVSNAKNLIIGQVGSAGTLTAGGPSGATAGQIIVTNNSTSSTITINSVIANNGTGAVTMLFNGVSGSKTILTGTNTFTGGSTIASGAVEMQSAGALGSSGTANVQEGAAVQLSGGIATSRTFNFSGGGVATDGAIRSLSGNNSMSGLLSLIAPARINTDSGTLTLFLTSASTNIITGTQALTIGGAGNTVINSRINITTASLIKDGTGTLTLNGDNTFTGTTTINAGVLRATSATALGASAVTVSDGGALEFSGGITASQGITFNGVGINGGGAIRNLSGNNTLSGILAVGLDAAGPRISADSGTTLTLSGTLRSGATAAGTRSGNLAGAGTINVTGSITNGTTPATFLTGLNKLDSGTVNLRNTNTYTALTTIRGGALNLDFANATPTTHLIPSGNSISLAGGTLQLSGKDAVTNSQGFISTTMTGGRSAIVVNSGVGGTANLALGTITRANSSGSAVNITLPTTGSITTTTLNLGGNGIINGGMTVGGNTWATSAATQSTAISWNNAADTIAIGSLANNSQVSFATAPGGLTAGVTYYVVNSTASSFQVAASEGGTPIALTSDGTTAAVNLAGAITGLPLASYSSTFATNANVDVAGGTLTQGAVTVNSLRFNAAAGTTLNLSSTLTSLTGGLLVTSAVTGDVTIQSTTATARTFSNSTTPADFTVHHYGSGLLTIGSTIAMTNAVGFTKTGPGPMTFAAGVSSSAVQIRATEGTLNFVGSNRFTGTTDPTLFIGSATATAKVSFGNGATVGAESFTGISVLGTGSSLVGGGSALYTISMQNGGTNDWRSLTIGGAGTNENNLSLEAFSGGTLQLGSANTYAGRNNLGRSTWEVSVIENAGVASSLGTGAQVSTIDMHDTTSTSAVVSTLRYIGTANASTDRAIRLITDGVTMPSLTGVVENNGTGTLKFTSAFTAVGNTTLPRTLRLSGTNTGVNEIVSMTDGPSSIVTLDKAGAGRWALTGDSTYTGGTTISAGTLQLGNGGTGGTVGTGDIAISAGATLATNRSDTHTIANNITGAGSVTISNTSGKTVLSSSSNTYSGGTVVKTGTLVFTNTSGSATGTGSVTVDTPATLAGSGRIAPAADNSVQIIGTLSIGTVNTVAADAEIITSGTGTLRIEGSGALFMDLVSGAGLGDNSSLASSADVLVLGGTLTLETGSTLRVQNPNAMTSFTAGDLWRLFDYSTLGGSAVGTFTTLDLPVLTGGLFWDTSKLYTTGTISIAPEPQRALLISLGLASLLMRRRRSTR